MKAQKFITKRWQRKEEHEDFFIEKSHNTFSFLITRIDMRELTQEEVNPNPVYEGAYTTPPAEKWQLLLKK